MWFLAYVINMLLSCLPLVIFNSRPTDALRTQKQSLSILTLLDRFNLKSVYILIENKKNSIWTPI
jgi:hypothetical protein